MMIYFHFILLFLSSIGWNKPVELPQNKVKEKIVKPAKISKSLAHDNLQELINDYCIQKSKLDNGEIEFQRCQDSISLRRHEIEDNIIRLEKPQHKKVNPGLILQKDTSLMRTDSVHGAEKLSGDNLKFRDSLMRQVQFLDSVNHFAIQQLGKRLDHLKDSIHNFKAGLSNQIKKINGITRKLDGSLALNLCGTRYLIYIANLDSVEIGIHWLKNNKENFYDFPSVKEYLLSMKSEPLMITNAGMFTEKYEPQGLYIEPESKYTKKLNTKKALTGTNFYLFPNGVFFLDRSNVPHIETTDNYENLLKEEKFIVKLATQSGPMLVINDTIHPRFTKGSKNQKIRSGVGIINEKKVTFVITTDESNFYDFALFFKELLDCKNALFLDGAISKMYLKDLNPGESGGNFGPIISVTKKPIK